MLKTFCFAIVACVTLSACGGGGNTGFPTGGGSTNPDAYVTGEIACDSGCNTTQGGIQVQIQPNTTIGTGSTNGCSFKVSFSNTSSDLGIPGLAGAIMYASLLAPSCGSGTTGPSWATTITFTSVDGNTTNWPSVTASVLNSQNQWINANPTSTATSLTINTTVTSGTQTGYAIAN